MWQMPNGSVNIVRGSVKSRILPGTRPRRIFGCVATATAFLLAVRIGRRHFDLQEDVRDSNPCSGLEKAVSQPTRRTRQNGSSTGVQVEFGNGLAWSTPPAASEANSTTLRPSVTDPTR